jgi:hypothetical protein
MNRFMVAIAAATLLLSAPALADTTLSYRSEGGCAGDFDRVQLKALFLRVDASEGGGSGSLIYDHAEKLAWFIDDSTHTFMETELDEDAVDLQADIMKSLRTKMRHENGVDPFEMAHALCPGMADANSRDRQPGEPIDCGNGTMLGGTAGPDGEPGGADASALMGSGQMQLDPNSRQMIRNMMEQQMAHMTPEQREQMQKMMASGPMAGLTQPGAGGPAPPRPPERVDRDAGEIEVAGIKCLRREHLRAGAMVREDCYAEPAALHLGDAQTRRIARFSGTFRAWTRSVAPEMKASGDDRVLVRRLCYASGRESGRATLTIDNGPIDASRFEVPAGYKPADLGLHGSDERDGR